MSIITRLPTAICWRQLMVTRPTNTQNEKKEKDIQIVCTLMSSSEAERLLGVESQDSSVDCDPLLNKMKLLFVA